MSAPSGPRPGPPRWVWVAYVLLFGASVPWYVPAGPVRLWFGLPHWVVLSFLAIAAVAVFTLAVVRRYWPDTDGDDAASPGGLPRP